MQSGEKKRRRRHSATFKAEAVAACHVPGASAAGVALERQINANQLRRWVKEAAAKPVIAEGALSNSAAFLPVAISGLGRPDPSQRSIRVQVRRRNLRVTIEWPASAAEHCAAWLKELLG